MKYYFILNPKSGKGQHADELEANIRSACEQAQINYEIHLTEGIGDATAFVKNICEKSGGEHLRFYACGGDGTLGEVVNGAAGSPEAAVGVIPVGTGNDFVRNFGSDPAFFDISAQLGGSEVTIDLLRCNDTYAVNMVNIGFDCEVVKKTANLKKHPFIPSKLAYIAGLVVTLVKKPGVHAAISRDDSDFKQREYLLTTFANGSFCGGGFNSNPKADLRDGMVDGLLINNISRMKFISLVGSYKKGEHLVPKNAKLLKTQKYHSVILKFPSQQSVSIDGELYEFTDLTIDAVPNALSLVLPSGVAEKYGLEVSKEAEVASI